MLSSVRYFIFEFQTPIFIIGGWLLDKLPFCLYRRIAAALISLDAIYSDFSPPEGPVCLWGKGTIIATRSLETLRTGTLSCKSSVSDATVRNVPNRSQRFTRYPWIHVAAPSGPQI